MRKGRVGTVSRRLLWFVGIKRTYNLYCKVNSCVVIVWEGPEDFGKFIFRPMRLNVDCNNSAYPYGIMSLFESPNISYSGFACPFGTPADALPSKPFACSFAVFNELSISLEKPQTSNWTAIAL